MNTKSISVVVKSDSWLGKLACRWLKTHGVAMVLGKTIHVYGIEPEDFLNDTSWLGHEMVHIRQFEEHGFIRFICLYLWEWMKHGYHNNRYEVEARDKNHQLESLERMGKYNFKIK